MSVQGTIETLTSSQPATATALPIMVQPVSKRVFYIPLVTALTTLTLLVLAVSSGWLGKGAHVGSRFGEASRAGLIKQPVNTYSSLGFVFTGLLIAWRPRRGAAGQNGNALTHWTFFHPFFASLVVCLGPGSMAMHATETRWGGRLDLLTMYMVAAFLTAYAVWRFFRWRRLWFLLLFGLVVALCFYSQDLHCSIPLMGNFGDFVFGFFIAVGALFEAFNLFIRKLDQDFKWGALSLGLLLIAFLIWNLSLPLSPSRSLLQGHAIWHLLCAVSAYCLFKYYVSEKPCRLSPALAGPGQENSRNLAAQMMERG